MVVQREDGDVTYGDSRRPSASIEDSIERA
jgi:hypothetical protein